MSATALSRLLEKREISSGELVENFLTQHAVSNPSINAIVALDADSARSQARLSDERARRRQRLGPLDGIPVTVKDNIFVAGLPATWAAGSTPIS